MKSKFYLPLIAMAIGMIGCTNDLVEEVSPIMGQRDVIAVSVDNADTRTAMAGYNVVWSEDDAIGIFVGSTNNEYELISDAGTTSGDFQSKGLVVASAETLKEAAYFPYVQGATWDSSTKTITTSLPATYEYAANTNNNAVMAALMVGDAQSSISFQNAGALYAITVENIPDGYNKAVMTYLDAEDNVGIAGAATITFNNNGEPTLAVPDAASAQKTITITFTGTDDKTFYFPMPVKASGYANKLQFSLQGEGKDAITAPVFTKEPVRSNLYAVTLKLDAVSGGIVSEANDIEAANAALANDAVTSVAVKDATDTEPITIPAKSTESATVEHTIDLSEATLPTTGPVEIVVTEGTGEKATVEKLTVIVPEDASAGSYTINAPGTTVTIQGADGTVIETIEATTAENTLIIGEGVTIKNLTIKKGNVELYGKLEKFTSEVATTIKLMKDIDLTSEWEIKQGMNVTLDLNGKILAVNNATNHGIDNEGTLTIDGNNGKITWVATDHADNAVYCIVNRAGATMNIDACEVAGPVYNVGNMTVENESKLTTNAANRAALICGEDTNDIAWKFTMTGGSIVSETHSAAVLKNNYYGLNPQGLGKFDGVTFTGTTYYDIVLCAVNVEVNNCTFTRDNIWLKADNYVSYVNGKETRKEDLYPCKWSEIYGTPITTLDALTAALAAAPIDGTTTTIVLGGDIDVTSELEIKQGMNVTLDLNGKILAVNNATNHGIDNEGTLTIDGNNGKITWVATDHADNAVYCIVNRAGATMNIDACEVAGPVYNVGNMTVENESKLTTNAANRAALICGEDTNDIAWKFTMTGGSIVSETHSAAVLKNNYYGLNPQGLGKFDGVTFTGTTYYDIVLCAVNVEVNNCTFTRDNIWLKADNYVSYVNGEETRKEDLYPCKWSEIFPATNE